MQNKALISEYEKRLAQADALLQEKLKRDQDANLVLTEKENTLKVIEDQIAEKSVLLSEVEKPPLQMFAVFFDDGSAGIFSEAELETVKTIPKDQFDSLTSLLSTDSALSFDWKQPYQPAKSTNKQLADDWRLFVAAIANLNAGKDEPFTYEDIYTWATECLKEINKRVKAGSMKFSISKEKSEAYQKLWNAVSKKVSSNLSDVTDAAGIYLVSPHAELIAAGKKSLIVKSRDFSNQCDKELILCSSGLCFGTLKMKLPREATRAELEELYPAHRITPEEIKEWWPDTKVFYLYDIYDVHIWDRPRHADIPQGVQTFIKKVELTDGKAEQDVVDPFLVYPDESKRYKGMVHAHTRGKSIHLDLRFQVSKDSLIGWTLYIPKGLSKAPGSLAECKRLVDAEIIPIVKEKLSDPTKKFNAGKKAVEPIEWLKYEGEVEPGGVGATRYESGFFYIIDSFDVQFGASKSYYHEVFCENAKLFDGRLVFRLLENREEWKQTGEGLLTWMFNIALKSPTPYTITTRAVKKKWVPPPKASALPRRIRDKIPEKYKYWEKEDEKKRLECRDELVSDVKEKLIKLDAIKKGKFKLLRQTFEGRKIVREGPTRTRYFFATKIKNSYWAFISYDDILTTESASGLVFEHPRELWTAEGDILPSTELNETKATPSFIKILDEGNLTLFIKDKTKNFILSGKKVKDSFVAYQQEGSSMWNLEKGKSVHLQS